MDTFIEEGASSRWIWKLRSLGFACFFLGEVDPFEDREQLVVPKLFNQFLLGGAAARVPET